MPTDVLILILSNKGAKGDVGDTMVVRTAAVNFTRFKGSIKIKEGPRAVRSFTFQRVVIPGSVEVVIHKIFQESSDSPTVFVPRVEDSIGTG